MEHLFPFSYFFLLSFWGMTFLSAQSTLYYQDFGTTAGGVPPDWMVSTSLITTATTSSSTNDCSTASGGANLFAPNCTPPGDFRSFGVSNISTLNASGISISFCHRRTNAFDVPILLEWSVDGNDWNPVSEYSSGVASTTWSLAGPFSLPMGADNQSNLRFQYSYTTDETANCVTSVPNYRIDDFKVTATTLPVELTNFVGRVSGGTVELVWETATEFNSAYFEIWRSGEDFDFQSIGRVKAQGFSHHLQSYLFVDEAPLQGINYYRLKQYDRDGSFTFSNNIAVYSEPASIVRLYPTVAKEALYLDIPEDFVQASKLWIYNAAGFPVNSFSLGSGTLRHPLDIRELPVGFYFIRLESQKGKNLFKFMKIN